MKKIFVPQKKHMRLLTFFDYPEHTSLIFKSLKALKLQNIIHFSILELIFFILTISCQRKSKHFYSKRISQPIQH